MAKLLLLLLPLLIACAGLSMLPPPPEPVTAELRPIYEIPTMSLAEKAAHLRLRLVADHLNDEGLLLYNVRLPLGDYYVKSHNSADVPTWHGHWLASLAFKMAVDFSPQDILLAMRALSAIDLNFEITGHRGLLSRSWVRTDTQLTWMKTQEQDPDKYWRQGNDGYWFRTGPAKGHYSGTVFGLATLLGLERAGAYTLPDGVHDEAARILHEISERLIRFGYRIQDWDGETTEFGKLYDWQLNGFNALQLLAMLRASCAEGSAPSCAEYARFVSTGAGDAVGSTLHLLWTAYWRAGRHNFSHFSDDMHVYTNALVLWLYAADEDIMEDARYALRGLWKTARHSRNPHLIFCHQAVMGRQDENRYAVETLFQFPRDKLAIRLADVRKTNQIQPIPNQRINSHYWKTNYFKRAVTDQDSATIGIEFSGQDYLVVYWMGRYFGFVEEGQ